MVGIYGAYDVTWAYNFFSIFGQPLLSITIIFFNSMDLLFLKKLSKWIYWIGYTALLPVSFTLSGCN